MVYGRDSGENGVGFSPRARDFSLLPTVTFDPEAKQASCSVDNGAVFPGGKAAETLSLPLPFIKYRAQTVNGAEFILHYLPSCHSQ
jgi:hypothetical protein